MRCVDNEARNYRYDEESHFGGGGGCSTIMAIDAVRLHSWEGDRQRLIVTTFSHAVQKHAKKVSSRTDTGTSTTAVRTKVH